MDRVLTLAAPHPGGLTVAIVADAGDALNGLGAETGDVDWLASGQAADIAFTGIDVRAAEMAVRGVLDGHALDILAGANAGRRKRLLVADMDATIVTSETLDDLAAHAGLKDAVAAITKKAMNGELKFSQAVKDRGAMLADLPTSALADTYDETTLTAGAVTLVRTMRGAGAHCALVSGGFTYFASRVADACGFHEHHANRFEIADARLTGKIIEPILGKAAKRATLERLAAELDLTPSQTLAVGDGANDLPMIEAAGLGVAYHGKPVVAAAAPACIDYGDLTTLLYFQGYRLDEFAADT